MSLRKKVFGSFMGVGIVATASYMGILFHDINSFHKYQDDNTIRQEVNLRDALDDLKEISQSPLYSEDFKKEIPSELAILESGYSELVDGTEYQQIKRESRTIMDTLDENMSVPLGSLIISPMLLGLIGFVAYPWRKDEYYRSQLHDNSQATGMI